MKRAAATSRKPASVPEYIAGFPPATRSVLRRVRAAIRKGMPKAEEVISYSIPAFKVGGRVAIYFAGWKAHYSIYPSTRPLIERFGHQLEPYDVNDKGTIRFPLAAPVPVELITSIARFKAEETARRARAAAGPRRRSGS